MRQRWHWIPVVLAILFELWLVAGFPISAQHGPHDPELFLRQAGHLRDGNWLGPYDELTLAKGMFYPLFIAAGYYLCIPLVTLQHILHLSSCMVLALALNGLLENRPQKTVLFVVLALNPAIFVNMTYTFRNSVYPALSLLMTACLVGMYARLQSPGRAFLRWSIGCGLALSAFWLTREEGVWILPACAVAAGYMAWKSWRAELQDRFARAGTCLLPFAVLLLSLAFVSAMNYLHYGVFLTNELKSKQFRSAYGGLLRVKHAENKRYIPVPRETRERIYEVSPSFAELRGWLDGDRGKMWAGWSSHLIGAEEAGRGEIGGGHFVWAFRDAAAKAGYHRSAPAALAFYKRMADEVNQACEDGRLECGRRRSSLAPPWRVEYRSLLPGAFGKGLIAGVFPPWERTINPHSTLWPKQRDAIYGDITWMETAPRRDEAESYTGKFPGRARLLWRKSRIIHGIMGVYMHVIPFAAVCAGLWHIVLLTLVLKQRRVSAAFWICSVVLVAYLCRIALLSYVDIAATGIALDFRRLSVTYPLVLVYSIVGILDFCNRAALPAFHRWRSTVRARPADSE